MELINYLGIILLTFIGFIAGLTLPNLKSIKEELKPGRRYFINFKNIASALVFGFIFYHETSIVISFGAIIILLFVFYKLKTLKSIIYYILFALAIAYSQKNQELLNVVASIIFITGLPLGTLQYIDNNKNLVKKTLVVGAVYLVISLALFFL